MPAARRGRTQRAASRRPLKLGSYPLLTSQLRKIGLAPWKNRAKCIAVCTYNTTRKASSQELQCSAFNEPNTG